MMGQTKKYLMFISYVGSGFRGSQLQLQIGSDSKEPLKTVQYVIERGLKHIFKLEGERPLPMVLSSRTDKGVHALRTAVAVFLPKGRFDFIKPNHLVELLNSYLSKSENVRVLEAYIVPDSFQFKEFIKHKTYLYRVALLKEEFHKNFYKKIIPITEVDRTYFLSSGRLYKPFDLMRAQEAAHLFEGIKDFIAVMAKAKLYKRPTVCNVMSFSIQESQPLFPFDPLCQRFYFYHFLCKGDKFLYQMVRRMVTLTLAVGFNVLDLKDIQKLFDEPSPSSWPNKGNHVVPGYGLYLIDTRIDLERIQKEEEITKDTNGEVQLEMNLSEESVKDSS